METCTNCKKTHAMPVRQVAYGTDLPALTGGHKLRRATKRARCGSALSSGDGQALRHAGPNKASN
jgi:hypothetical protein